MSAKHAATNLKMIPVDQITVLNPRSVMGASLRKS